MKIGLGYSRMKAAAGSKRRPTVSIIMDRSWKGILFGCVRNMILPVRPGFPLVSTVKTFCPWVENAVYLRVSGKEHASDYLAITALRKGARPILTGFVTNTTDHHLRIDRRLMEGLIGKNLLLVFYSLSTCIHWGATLCISGKPDQNKRRYHQDLPFAPPHTFSGRRRRP